MNNHIFLIIGLFDELLTLKRFELWLARARQRHPIGSPVLAVLDEQEVKMKSRQEEIYDLIFEIPRSN